MSVIKLTQRGYQKLLESCVRFGTPCLLENIEEKLDPYLEPIL